MRRTSFYNNVAPSLGILCDREIRELALRRKMIVPYVSEQVRQERDAGMVISYGQSGHGYDVRVANKFKVFSNARCLLVDPKHFDSRAFVNVVGDHCDIPPNSFALASSVETIRVPENVMVLCIGKSTYARLGIVCNVTPLEAQWYGKITIEISNTTPLPARIYANEGIIQLLFFRGARPDVTYGDRHGKYQNQRGIVLPRV